MFVHSLSCTAFWQKNIESSLGIFVGAQIAAHNELSAFPVSAVAAEADLYPRWRAVLPALNIDGTPVVLMEKHGVASLYDETNLYPDLVAYTANSPQRPLYVELAGDLKVKQALPFEARHYNQIRRYAAAQLDRQSLRPHFFCFLANADSIEFFKFVRSPEGGLTFTRTEALALRGEGGHVLLHLLRTDPFVRGTRLPPPLSLPSGALIVLEEHLGAGASAFAFRGSADGGELVVKWFKTTEQFKCEVHHLQLLAPKLAASTRIPTVVHFAEAQRLVALSPVARKFSLRSSSSPSLYRAFLLRVSND
jgi:hypothetical protein